VINAHRQHFESIYVDLLAEAHELAG